ncbi:MAG: hypothetical protein FJ293_10020 [Planctomycetes bacterium]|nr:hypothetical protein [Planctomycetota bacterium]
MSDEIQEFEAAPEAAAPAATAPVAMPGAGPQPADPRLYRFFWGGMACVVGVIFPFTSAHPEWKADTFNRALNGPAGTETFFGALIGFFALLVAAQYWWCMKYRKVRLWPFLVMLVICIGAWTMIAQGFAAKLQFDWMGKVPTDPVVAARTPPPSAVPGGAWIDVRFWNSFFTHIGAGWLLVALGSTSFVWTFASALMGLGKKKGPAPASPAGRRR